MLDVRQGFLALGLGRVPRLIGRILRRIDRAGIGYPRSCVVGTNALFAYEADASFTPLTRGDYRVANATAYLVKIIESALKATSRTPTHRQPDEEVGTAGFFGNCNGSSRRPVSRRL